MWSIYIHAHIQIFVCIYVHTWRYMCVYLYVYVCMYIHACIYYVYMHLCHIDTWLSVYICLYVLHVLPPNFYISVCGEFWCCIVSYYLAFTRNTIWFLICSHLLFISQEMSRSSFSVELDAANATWISNDVAMLSTKSGELLLLTLVHDGRCVTFTLFFNLFVCYNFYNNCF